jgi:hypothetical protein
MEELALTFVQESFVATSKNMPPVYSGPGIDTALRMDVVEASALWRGLFANVLRAPLFTGEKKATFAMNAALSLALRDVITA